MGPDRGAVAGPARMASRGRDVDADRDEVIEAGAEVLDTGDELAVAEQRAFGANLGLAARRRRARVSLSGIPSYTSRAMAPCPPAWASAAAGPRVFG